MPKLHKMDQIKFAKKSGRVVTGCRIAKLLDINKPENHFKKPISKLRYNFI